MKRILLTFFVASLLLGLSACGEGKSSVDYESIIQQFADNLFAGKFEDAKAMLTEENMAEVSAQVDKFGAIYEKYKFQEILLASTRPGAPSGVNPESDKRAQFTYQFSPKDSEDWAYGWVEIRAVNQDGVWVVTEVKLGRPTK
jgi:hypothetical protein